MKNLNELIAQIPDFAKDVKINLQNVLGLENQGLTQDQIFGAALACAYASKEKNLICALENEAKKFLSEAQINASKTASALMAMNNIYYRFLHLTSDEEYKKMPANLRMKGIIDHGIAKVDFEIFSLAVSVLNGCGMCVEAHANQLLKNGLMKNQVQMVAKIAAIINSAAQVLTIQNQENFYEKSQNA